MGGILLQNAVGQQIQGLYVAGFLQLGGKGIGVERCQLQRQVGTFALEEEISQTKPDTACRNYQSGSNCGNCVSLKEKYLPFRALWTQEQQPYDS